MSFTWSADDPPLHARYRMEWKFKKPVSDRSKDDLRTLSPADLMRSLGIAQDGDPVLAEVARPFDLPEEAEDARRVVAQLVSALERVSGVHTFSKGMGLAAPQVNIGRAAAVVRTSAGEMITLMNPRVIDRSAEEDDQYEGCLSFSTCGAWCRARLTSRSSTKTSTAPSGSRRSIVASPGS